MNILITGGNFSNKGAQLMLVSLINAIKKQLPSSTIVVSPVIGNRLQLKDMGIQVLDFPLFHYGNQRYFKKALRFPFFIKLLMKLKGKDYSGEVKIKDIDVIFDISGFAFGDKWGNTPLNNLDYFIKWIKRYNTKFILLPQALGTFTKAGMSTDIQSVVSNVDLIIARDRQSFGYVNDILQKDNNRLMLFPDITLTFKNKVSIKDDMFSSPYCLIVPNERMLDKASKNWQTNYYHVMSRMINLIMENSSLNVVMLIHAGGGSKDGEVGNTINEKVSSKFNDRLFYYVEEDPVRLKGIISGSYFLIGSRFHALASSLSSNVPAIGTSWLHKYEMLFDDYGCSEFSFNEPIDTIYTQVLALIDKASNEKIVGDLKIQNAEVIAKSDAMWNQIKVVIER